VNRDGDGDGDGGRGDQHVLSASSAMLLLFNPICDSVIFLLVGVWRFFFVCLVLLPLLLHSFIICLTSRSGGAHSNGARCWARYDCCGFCSGWFARLTAGRWRVQVKVSFFCFQQEGRGNVPKLLRKLATAEVFDLFAAGFVCTIKASVIAPWELKQ